ncbi:MAG: MBOAT family protein [Clostridium sp.]|nr:MBOAT family protein [Clostridium sp.]
MEKIIDILAYDKVNPLLFNTGLFLLLFAAFLLIYQACSKWPRAKMLFVILFSLYFYYKSSAECCFILLGVCVSDYVLGRWMGVAHKGMQRVIIGINVVINLGMLVYFKYLNLLFDTFASITKSSFDALDIILPAGISFFTFRSIAYLVDIYRGQMRPCRNFMDYCFFLTFFPPLLAGPVVRAKDMLPQIEARPQATRAMVSEGLFLIILGLVKKVIVADYISGNFVDRIFENPSLYTGLENVFGAFGFTLQLYCDFSGYSDMAIGIALLLGYRFKDNFNAPFKSQNPTEFWKRWHISLSSWLMDYLYIPLGGNRKGKSRQRANLMTTMLLGGLWHGASWMYVLWGGYHGALLVGHKALKDKGVLPKDRPWTRPLAIAVTLVLVVIGFTFFRAPSMQTIADMYTAIFTNFHPEVLPQFVAGYAVVVSIIAIAFAAHFLPTRWLHKVRDAYGWLPWAAQALILAIIIFIVIQARQSSLVPFIYLQY